MGTAASVQQAVAGHATVQKELTVVNAALLHLAQEYEVVRLQNIALNERNRALEVLQVQCQQDLDKLRSVADQLMPRDDQLGSTGLAPAAPVPDVVSAPAAAQSARRGRHREGLCAPLPLSTAEEGENTAPLADIDPATLLVLINALAANPYLSRLTTHQRLATAKAMRPVLNVSKGDVIMRAGEAGDCLYVVEQGLFEVCLASGNVTSVGVGDVLGEMAIMYKCNRTATVTALSPARLWVISRTNLRLQVIQSSKADHQHTLEFISSTPLFRDLSPDFLFKVVQAFRTVEFTPGQHVFSQGDEPDYFYMLLQGKVVVSIRQAAGMVDVRTLRPGEHFGEASLTSTTRRTATCTCTTAVTCLWMGPTEFSALITPLEALGKLKFQDRYPDFQESVVLSDILLSDLKILTTLGQGGFGRVQLVQSTRTGETFALKVLNKAHICTTNQEQHVLGEKRVLAAIKSPFCVEMVKTYKDKLNLYILMEVCLGGELWTYLRRRTMLDDGAARFYVANVVEAFAYLHSLQICFRDLKPENLMIGNNGYLKLVDFGFAKKLTRAEPTWTFCGTPDYMAPEIVLSQGHDIAVDYWALGILVFELLVGRPPFSAPDAMATYNFILQGIRKAIFPPSISAAARDLTESLCHVTPSHRLGMRQEGIAGIKNHPWFKGFNWAALGKCLMAPVFVPELPATFVSSRYFDVHPSSDGRKTTLSADVDLLKKINSGWDADF